MKIVKMIWKDLEINRKRKRNRSKKKYNKKKKNNAKECKKY
jgi:hypothetical protein